MKFSLHIWFSMLTLLAIVIACGPESDEPTVHQDTFIDRMEEDGDSITFKCIIDTPICNETGCYGVYRGVEFIHPKYIEQFQLNGTDVAHQYSNKMAEYVGKKLKQLYLEGNYSKVDFNRIRMSTTGMGSGYNYVEYYVEIPFKKVPKEQAMTAFDHCGGWGHVPDLKQRKIDLLKSPKTVVKNRKLYISRLFITKEGLQEYWIQWRHKDYQ